MLDFAEEVLNSCGPALFSVGQAGYIIKSSSGQLLAIDLYLSDCVESLEGHMGFKRLLPKILQASDLVFNVIICTHPHLDHFDIDSVPEMLAKGGGLYCSVDCEKLVIQTQLEARSNQITYVKPGDHALAGDYDITFVNCDHGEGAPDAVGVIVKVDGKTVYEVGDSCLRLDRIKEINSISDCIDVLICPINGMYGNMNSEEALRFSQALNPGITIPCHYGMFASHGGNLKSFYDKATEQHIPIIILQQGEKLRL